MKTIIQILLVLLCTVSFSYGDNSKDINLRLVSSIVGHSMSQEVFKQKNSKKVDISYIKNKLQNYLHDRDFKFKYAFISQAHREANNLYIKGVITHADSINRNINTKFEASYSIKNRNQIIVNNIKLKNYAKPRSLFFVVLSCQLLVML